MPISPYLKDLRSVVGTDLLLSTGAALLIRDDQGRVLLQRRSDNGLWGTPGGSVDPGEAPAQAAVREAYEETGLLVKPRRCSGVLLFRGSYPNGDRLDMTVMVFDCGIVGGALQAQDGESLELAFFAAPERPESAFLAPYPKSMFASESGKPYFEWDDDWLKALAATVTSSGMSPYYQNLRAKIGNRLMIVPVAVAVVRDEAGRLLLVRHKETGRWALPGGAAEPGEAPAFTAMRETYEETGLKVKLNRLLAVAGGEAYRYTYTSTGDKVEVHQTVFEAEIVGGELQALDGEALELRFFPLDQLPPPADMASQVMRDFGLATLLEAQAPLFAWEDSWLDDLR